MLIVILIREGVTEAMFDIGAEIKRRREALGISQNQLAKRSGCAQSTLSAIENTTKKPSSETLAGIAEALGCTVAELRGETPSAAPRLTAEERQLLRVFRHLNQSGRAYVRDMADYALGRDEFRQETSSESAM